MGTDVQLSVRVVTGLPVQASLGTELLWFQFDIGAPEEINLGTGKRLFYYLDAA